MKIVDVDAYWLHVPLEPSKQHVSDFGRMTAFDSVLVKIVTDSGHVGWGEAKAGVGSAGNGAALVAIVRDEFRPQLIGQDPRLVNRQVQRLYNGSRASHALRLGRNAPILGRRGAHLGALSGIDLALWDLLGKATNQSVLTLLGGGVRDSIPAYGSGGWADAANIGRELGGYVATGLRGVKMRLGAMDGTIATSLARVRAAREALGPSIALMVDAHGTMTVPQAKHFANEVAALELRWLEEPVSQDDPHGMAEVRRNATMPIAAGESECTVFAYRELLDLAAIDVVQPDLAICGGLTEGLRIAALTYAHQRDLAPHCWGSAISLHAAITLSLLSPSAVTCEWPMGGAPLIHDLFEEVTKPQGGEFFAPRGPGFGLTPNESFIAKHSRTGP